MKLNGLAMQKFARNFQQDRSAFLHTGGPQEPGL